MPRRDISRRPGRRVDSPESVPILRTPRALTALAGRRYGLNAGGKWLLGGEDHETVVYLVPALLFSGRRASGGGRIIATLPPVPVGICAWSADTE